MASLNDLQAQYLSIPAPASTMSRDEMEGYIATLANIIATAPSLRNFANSGQEIQLVSSATSKRSAYENAVQQLVQSQQAVIGAGSLDNLQSAPAPMTSVATTTTTTPTTAITATQPTTSIAPWMKYALVGLGVIVVIGVGMLIMSKDNE